MLAFPAVDNELMQPKAAAIGASRELLESIHTTAENANSLFSFCHLALGRTATELFEPAQRDAFLSGVRAYEIIGFDELSTKEHKRYVGAYAMHILAKKPGGNFALDFIEALERAYESMIKQTPRLSNAVDIIANREIADPSQELSRFALRGAAMMRSSQLEVDNLLTLEEALA